jgi:DNA-binding response OmpR family regulator
MYFIMKFLDIGGRPGNMRESNQSLVRILIVDDDPNLCASIADGLQLLGGYEVIQAKDGAEGLEVFFRERPDCVVVDIRMPDINGYQMMRAIRGDPASAQTPIVVLSALVQNTDQVIGDLSGADVYLFKPVDIDILIQEIERAIHITPESRKDRFRRLAEEQP